MIFKFHTYNKTTTNQSGATTLPGALKAVKAAIASSAEPFAKSQVYQLACFKSAARDGTTVFELECHASNDTNVTAGWERDHTSGTVGYNMN